MGRNYDAIDANNSAAKDAQGDDEHGDMGRPKASFRAYTTAEEIQPNCLYDADVEAAVVKLKRSATWTTSRGMIHGDGGGDAGDDDNDGDDDGKSAPRFLASCSRKIEAREQRHFDVIPTRRAKKKMRKNNKEKQFNDDITIALA